MIPKPAGCRGCPWEHKSKWFVPDEVRPGARVTVLGQNPGSHEEAGERLVKRAGKIKVWEPAQPAPFLGDSGYDLERSYLPLAGLVREDVSLCNTVRCRLGGGNKLPQLGRTETRDAIRHCQRAHFHAPASGVVVVLGEYALWAAAGEDGGDPPPYGISRKITGWRGWTLPWSPFQRRTYTGIWNPPHALPGPLIVHPSSSAPATPDTPAETSLPIVYATLHPASVYESPHMKPAALKDWRKLGHLLAGTWPRPLPPIKRSMAAWPPEFAFDTEFWEQEGHVSRLVRWSAATDTDVWVVEAGMLRPRRPPVLPRVVMHQADADIDNLEKMFGGTPPHEDTMYAHHALWSELPHDLDFLGSLYSPSNRWKHLAKVAPVEYAAGDAWGTWHVWRALAGELGRDPLTEGIYREYLLPLLPIVARARRMGIRVHADRASSAVQALRAAQHVESLQAQSVAGWPINLGSPAQVAAHGYGVEKW